MVQAGCGVRSRDLRSGRAGVRGKVIMSESFKSEIENVLSFILAMEDKPATSKENVVFDIPRGFFSGMEPFYDNIIESMSARQKLVTLYASNPFITDLTMATELSKNLDVSILQNVTEGPQYRFGMSRFRTVSPASLRGKTKGSSHLNIEVTTALVRRDLSYDTARSYMAKAGTGFRLLEYTDPCIGSLPKEEAACLDGQVRIAIGVAMARHYAWRIKLGYLGSPGLSLSTDPEGVLAILAARETGAKGNTRASLLHWVTEHWRKKRSEPGAFSRVRAHLRGKTSFVWDGIHCEIVPSPADVASYERGGGQVFAPWER